MRQARIPNFILTILQAQCQVFATTFNPEGVRMGNKVLRQRLKGPALAAYYPRKMATIKDVKREFGPVLATWDEGEEDRFEYIEEYVDLGYWLMLGIARWLT